MRSKLVLETVLVAVMLSVFVQCREVRAIELTTTSQNVLNSNGTDLVPSSNIQPIEDILSNVTPRTYHGFMPKFPIDYSSGSDAIGMPNSVISAAPNPNIPPIDGCLSKVTPRTYPDFKLELSIDYSSGSSNSTRSETTGMVDSVISTVPEFPPSIVLLLFIVATVLGTMVLKTKRFV